MNKSSGTTVTFDPKNTSETALWVEKFKPKNFMELLSDDVSNSFFTAAIIWNII